MTKAKWRRIAKRALARAIEHYGSQVAMAAAIKRTPQYLSQSVKRGYLGAKDGDCLKVEADTDGKVTRYELRPDIYGESPEQRKAA